MVIQLDINRNGCSKQTSSLVSPSTTPLIAESAESTILYERILMLVVWYVTCRIINTNQLAINSSDVCPLKNTKYNNLILCEQLSIVINTENIKILTMIILYNRNRSIITCFSMILYRKCRIHKYSIINYLSRY